MYFFERRTVEDFMDKYSPLRRSPWVLSRKTGGVTFWTIDHGFQVLHIRHDDRFHCVLYLLRPPARILLLLCQLPLPKVPSDDLYLHDGTCNYSPLLFYYLLFPKAALAPGIPFRAMSWNVVLFVDHVYYGTYPGRWKE